MIYVRRKKGNQMGWKAVGWVFGRDRGFVDKGRCVGRKTREAGICKQREVCVCLWNVWKRMLKMSVLKGD